MSRAVLSSPYEILTLTKTGRPPVRLEGRTTSFDYYESLLSPYVTANLTFIDSGNSVEANKKYDPQERLTNIFNGLPITGGEKLAVKIASKYGTIDFTKNPLRVSTPISPTEDSNRKVVMLNLVSDLAFKDKEATIFPTYTGKISDSVEKIIKTYFQLPKDKIFISKTKNSYSFQSNSRSPFDILCSLARKSVPEQGKPGYFCYETKEGLNYKSIDDLVKQSSAYTYFRTDVMRSDPQTDENDFKIASHSIDQNHNVLNALERGAYVSRNIFFDPDNLKYDEVIFKLSQKKLTNSLGKKEVDIPTENSFTRTHSHILDIGTLDSKVDGGLNNSPKVWQAESTMRYNLLFTQIVDITVPCNADLRAGDVVSCEFESVSQSGKELGSIDSTQSGNYLILNLCHHFDPKRSFSRLILVRDTYGLYTKKGV